MYCATSTSTDNNCQLNCSAPSACSPCSCRMKSGAAAASSQVQLSPAVMCSCRMPSGAAAACSQVQLLPAVRCSCHLPSGAAAVCRQVQLPPAVRCSCRQQSGAATACRRVQLPSAVKSSCRLLSAATEPVPPGWQEIIASRSKLPAQVSATGKEPEPPNYASGKIC